jgi:hypothetical protein
MQNSLAAVSFLVLFTLSACNNVHEKQAQEINTKETQPPYFPVTDFLLGQLNEIDSMPVTPVKITIAENKEDSVWLKKKDIRSFALPFLQPVIDSNFIQQFYTGSSFMDQTINTVTFSYDAKSILPDSIKLNHWDVYIDPQKNTVQRIYLVKNNIVKGVSVTTQFTWTVNKWCSIRTITQLENKSPEIKEEIMKWDFD